jgi:hypothetical protein
MKVAPEPQAKAPWVGFAKAEQRKFDHCAGATP